MLQGKTAVITGGTRGIGLAIAEKYLEQGACVAIAGSRQESVEKALGKLASYGDRVMGIWPNLCDPQAVAEAFASVKARFGSLDILVNNAGISSRTSLYDYTLEEFTKIMDLNVTAVFVCTTHHEGAGRRCGHQHQLHGQRLRPALGLRISHQQICGQRVDPLSGTGTGEGSDPRQRSGARRHPDGYGGGIA